ncbi:MAG: DNA-3-methyladenine glycosylase [Armatimonadota bacterium]
MTPRSGSGFSLTNGPGKLAQALAIDKSFDGHDLTQPPLRLYPGEPAPAERIVATPRIGISRAVDCPWRFYVRESHWVSRR